MNVDWKVILHSEQRYESTGDWYWSEDRETLFIRISRMKFRTYEFLAGLHELIEAWLCGAMGITQQEVDSFDMAYEASHQRGDATYPCGCHHERLSNPGEDRHSPYRWPHLIAEAAESVVARALRVDWADYDEQSEKPTP